MKILIFILNIFLNDVVFFFLRAALAVADIGLALWILHSFAGISFHWLVTVSLILAFAGWGIYRLLTKKRAGAEEEPSGENADDDAETGETDWSDSDSFAGENDSSCAGDAFSQDEPDSRGGQEAAPGIPDKVPAGMGSKLIQILFLLALCCCLSYEVFRDASQSIISAIREYFSPEIAVRTEAELMGIKTVEKLYTGFAAIDMEDMHYGESMLSGRYLDGVCIKKYRIYYGYRDIGKYLDDEQVMNAVCRGNAADLPKPALLSVNSQNQEPYGNYDVSGRCYTWDTDPESRKAMLMGFMNRYEVFKIRDSQEQLLTFLKPACDTIIARKAAAASPDSRKK